MTMISLCLLRLAAVAVLALGLAGCGKSESYKYKLTLAVDTPVGIKRGSGVVEVQFYAVSIPARGVMHKLSGEALYLDLGAGARPLIALLTCRLHPKYDDTERWTPDAGPEIRRLSRLYGEVPSAHFMDDLPRIALMRGPRRITPADLPDLVTFADINDPNSVVEVDPNDLQATLGPNITWHEIILEVTDEPVTRGIETMLPWIPAYFDKNLRLDGTNHGAAHELSNILSWPDFDQSSALKRRN